MKKIILCLAFLITAMNPAFAMLSGYYESVNQIEAILHSKELSDTAYPINSIAKLGDDNGIKYEIKTLFCTFEAVLERQKQSVPSPSTYAVNVKKKRCSKVQN